MPEMECTVGSSAAGNAGRPPCRCVVPSSNTPRTLWLQEAFGLKYLGDWASALHPAWSCKRPQQWSYRAPLWSNACFDWVTLAATVYTVCWTSSWAHKSAWIQGDGGGGGTCALLNWVFPFWNPDGWALLLGIRASKKGSLLSLTWFDNSSSSTSPAPSFSGYPGGMSFL